MSRALYNSICDGSQDPLGITPQQYCEMWPCLSLSEKQLLVALVEAGAPGFLVADFDSASSQHLIITDAAQTGLNFPGDFSIGFWFNTDGTACRLVNKYAGGTERSYEILYNGTVVSTSMSDTGLGATMTLTSSTNCPVNQWVHIVLTSITNGFRRLYQDGVQVAAFNYSAIGALYDNTTAFRLGAYSTPSLYLNGQMSQTGVWGRALTAGEVTDLYNSGTPRRFPSLSNGEKDSLISYWPLEEVSGTRLDSVGPNDLSDVNGTGSIPYVA